MVFQKKKLVSVLWLLLFLSASVVGNSFEASRPATRLPTKKSNSLPVQPLATKQDNSDDDAAPKPLSTLGDPPSAPTFDQFRKFALPCLGLWVAGPLLSLVDTSFVGLSGTAATSAEQLAALGPATTFFDGATYLFAFLNVATTNLYSSARAQAGEESEKAESVVRTAARCSLYCGFGIMAFLFAFCKPLLALYIGHEADSNPHILESAVDYVLIRAFSMPTSLLLGVLQAALLGAKDSVTPLIAILYSTIVNVCGDYLLVNRLKMGLRGAAIATMLAQWASTAALIGPARRRLVHGHGLLRKSKTGVTSKTFMAFAAPVLTLILGKLAAFGFMTHSAAAVPGQPTPLACHQIILSLFFFVSPFMEVISQTAQTFLPPFLAPVNSHIAKQGDGYDADSDKNVQEWRTASYKVGNRLMGIGFCVATIIASAASLIPAFFPNTLTSDGVVQAAVKPLAKYLWAGAFLTAPVAVAEGILLANRDLSFLASIYLVSTILLPAALLKIKNMGGEVVQVWGCFAAFQLFRALCFGGRIWGHKVLQLFGKGQKQMQVVEA